MANTYFSFKEFTVNQDKVAMKVCTDACLFGAWVADHITSRQLQPGNILDIGAGTGLLSLLVAQKTAGNITAVEIDTLAAQQARDNFSTSKWKERLEVIEGDVRKLTLDIAFDVIISNPPFFDNDLKSHDAKKNLALHSTELSLDDLIAFSSKHLLTKGFMAVLLPYHRTDSFIKLAEENGLFLNKQILVKQTEKHSYFRSMLIISKDKVAPRRSEIAIKENGIYSTQFIELLKDYYLYL